MAGNIKGITIELNGDATKLTTALSGVSKKSADLNKQLREVDQSLKFNPGNAELIAQKQRILKEAVENTKDKLDTLKEAHKQAQVQMENGEMGRDEFDALTREIIKTENHLEKFQKDLKKLDFSKLEEAGKKVQEVGEKTTAVGKGLSTNVTAPIVGVAAASIAAFNVVDEGLDTIVKKTGATGDAMGELKESFNNVYSTVPASAAEVGNAIGEINTQFGLTGPALDDATSYMLKFSQITDSDVTQSTILAKQAMEKFGLEANDLAGVLDAVAFEGQRTGVSSDKLFDTIVKGSPQLKAMGLDFKQSASLMATFEQKGVDSTKALGFLSRAQTNWAKDGKSLQQGLKELTEKLKTATTEEEKIAIAAEQFGIRGGTAMKEALGDLGISLDDLAVAAVDTTGTVGSTWEEMLDPIDQANLAMQNMNLAGAELGGALQEALLPIMQWLTEALKGLAEWFRNLSPEAQRVIIVVGLIVAAIGPLIVIIGTLITSVGAIMTAFAAAGPAIGAVAGPIAIAIGAIVAIIAIGVALYKNWDVIKEKAAAFGAYLSDKWDQIKSWTSEKWNGIKDAVWSAISAAWTYVAEKVSQISFAVSDKWNSIKKSTTDAWDAVKNKTSEIFSGIYNAISGKIGAARDFVKTAIDKIRSFFNFTWELPSLKLPRISVSGKFSLNPPQIPSFGISWYDKGGIFNSPTVIGVGEKRPEFVGALEDLRHLIGSELDKRQEKGPQIVVQNMTVREEADIKKIALELYRLQTRGV